MSVFQAQLTAEQALALRIVRMQTVPHEFWLWSNGNMKSSVANIAPWISENVRELIKEIIHPCMADANTWERKQSQSADAWISGIFGFVASLSTELEIAFYHRMLAASLLPLYRSLGSGKFHEALDQTRLRLADTLAMLAIGHHLQADFVELLTQSGLANKEPNLLLKSSLNIDLKSVSWLCRHATRCFDCLTGNFDEELLHHLTVDSAMETSRLESPWSEPSMLWQISGELQTTKVDLVLPREWLDIPLPWTKINDHWGTLANALVSEHRFTAFSFPTTAEAVDSIQQPNALVGRDEDDEVVSRIVDDLVGMQADFADVTGQEFIEDSEVTMDVIGQSHAAHQDNPIGPKMESRPEEYDKNEGAEFSQTRIVLAEISSHRDPLFVNIVRRHIATARNENKTVCLVALHVAAEDNLDHRRVHLNSANGLTLWQQKLVNWLARQPEFCESHAFVTVDGVLILCSHDVERSKATILVREGLESSMSAKPEETDSNSGLARLSTPARYYSGIGSVSSPNASFDAEQLITATWRCFSATQCQGKSAIKSIEVF